MNKKIIFLCVVLIAVIIIALAFIGPSVRRQGGASGPLQIITPESRTGQTLDTPAQKTKPQEAPEQEPPLQSGGQLLR